MSEELSVLLNVCLLKPLSVFDKRQIVRSCPCPDVDCVYTPVIDKFLPDLVPKCTTEDKVLRKTQDLLLDVTGPIAMSYENNNKIGPKYVSLSNESWENNGRELFGQHFEQCLKQRAETARAISTASFVQKGIGGGAASYRSAKFRGQTYRPSRSFSGRGRATASVTQSTPQNQ